MKANQGAAGVDGQSIEEFEADLKNNLYKLWNRLSSGSYFPPPVRRVDIRRVKERGRWYSDGRGPHCPDGGETAHGTGVGDVLSSRLLRVPAGKISQ